MAETVEEITINYEEDGQLIIKELDKQVLTKGAWATIMFRYQQWDRAKESYSGDLFTIQRYRKFKGSYSAKPHSKFNISSRKQAAQIVEILQNWLALEPEE